MSNWIFGIMAGLFGLIGLFMAAGAHDIGITIFGYALMVFAVLFCWFMIKTAFDQAERQSHH
jgi:uncharacterized membrane protein (DUF4010 family)